MLSILCCKHQGFHGPFDIYCDGPCAFLLIKNRVSCGTLDIWMHVLLWERCILTSLWFEMSVRLSFFDRSLFLAMTEAYSRNPCGVTYLVRINKLPGTTLLRFRQTERFRATSGDRSRRDRDRTATIDFSRGNRSTPILRSIDPPASKIWCDVRPKKWIFKQGVDRSVEMGNRTVTIDFPRANRSSTI